MAPGWQPTVDGDAGMVGEGPGNRPRGAKGRPVCGPEFSWLVAALLEQAPSVQGALHWTPRNSEHQS